MAKKVDVVIEAVRYKNGQIVLVRGYERRGFTFSDRILIDQIGKWWDPDHTFSGDSRNLSIDPKPGGCFCERLPDNGGVHHLTVVMLSPGKELRLTGALGPLQEAGVAGNMSWKLSEAGGRTRVELTYSVGGYRSGGLGSIASGVDSVLRGQLVRLKKYVETGRPS